MDAGPLQDTLDVSDPALLRALGHPVRMRVLMEIGSTRTLTATEVARLTGLTPSAASHHLRFLERHGLIERAPGEGDQRTRPWRRSHRSLNLGRPDDPAQRSALELTVRAQLGILADDLTAGLPGEQDRSLLSTGTHRLRPEEVEELRTELLALAERWSRRSEANGPEVPRVRLALAVAPLDDPAD
ncbi:helix-turn-helix domain-containing protein [Auraticoccus sp. F435]|uniref:Helix-turn-helix domain-containing protein n=1 Tax=Auraticoccus cholistanensis TaxID=2656650 RepID=A0A6A9V1R1_9ACTN|nr:winged helix-turn-helix domain-containing protein [Auraticoccus cholistanensis]MVA77528.1 helix-turn-helix domain-containing protein [Auraticoccus cholistanensis]